VVHNARGWYGAFKKFHWERLLEQLSEGGVQVIKKPSKTLVSEIHKVLEASKKLSAVALLQSLAV